MNIKEKLGAVQKVLKAPKNQYNSFGKYNYRSCEDILEAAKPLCVENGLILNISDDIIEVGGRIYVKATARVCDTESDEVISSSGLAREPEDKKGMDSSQVTGAASSYARKYALNGLFCIDDTKDADATNTPGKAAQPAASKAQQVAQKANEAGIAEPEKEYKCSDCMKPFTGFTGKDGKQYSAGQAYHISEKMNVDGKPRCSDCMNKAGTKKV
jgi:DNA-directed RNA polymerase subunit RPC12/RpoP